MISFKTIFSNLANPIPYDITGSLRRECIKDVNDVNITIHEQYRKAVIERLESIKNRYNIVIKSAAHKLVFSIQVKQVNVNTNISWYGNANKGLVLVYETGNIPFNQFILFQLKKKQYTLVGDSVYLKAKLIDIPDEQTLFQLIGYKTIPPQFRTSNHVSHHWKL